MQRREFGQGVLTAAVLSAFPSARVEAFTQARTLPADAAVPKQSSKLKVGMLMYPGLTLLDLVGPQLALSEISDIHLVWKTQDVFTSDSGVPVRPTGTLEDCPKDLDVLFVPGGPGMIPAMKDDVVLSFLADRGARAKYVTSVCTGSLVLGAAGLLKGYKATSHWTTVQFLPLFGALPTDGRVVIDRNRFTGGGVTAGIDFGLVLAAELRGEETAKAIQLKMEYNPQPPFHAGSPAQAGPVMTKMVLDSLAPFNKQIRAIADGAVRAKTA